MKKLLLGMCLFAFVAGINSFADETAKKESGNPKVLIETSMGNIKLELFPKKAPVTVKNFLMYVDEGLYNGTIFHRVISNFMIQGGGFTKDFKKKQSKDSIKNEADNGLSNEIGTIAMARTGAPHSATNQFFINVRDNYALDYKSKSSYGYCVFGKVISGMDVVNKIKDVETTTKGYYRDVPKENVVIKKIVRVK